ncbi:MAG: hypothetical protein PCFJNLEI_02570 [Verrucomicrobiae bacterium]|nr:hypothetical protein [Verrucomicrobiae bacterium]
MNIKTLLAGATSLLLAVGCSTTHQVRSMHDVSGFLGDYSQLRPGSGDEAKLIYVASGADFGKYHKVMIERVQLWQSEDPDSALGSLSKEDQQLLVDYLYTSLRDHLSKDYLLVDKPGDDVLRIRAAITEAGKSKPVLDLVSNVTPFGLGITYAKRIVFGTHTSVGMVTGEIELLDGGTGQRVAAAVDRRAGTKVLRGKFSRWGDVKDAFDFWARRLQTRLAELRAHQD